MQEHLKSPVCLWLIFPTNISASLRQRIITMRYNRKTKNAGSYFFSDLFHKPMYLPLTFILDIEQKLHL